MRRRTARELTALADGSLPEERHWSLRRRVAGSPKLTRALEEQLLAVHAIRGLADPAPPSLRSWLKRAEAEAPKNPGRGSNLPISRQGARSESGARLSRLLVHSGVVVVVLIAAAAVIVRGSFHRSSRVATPSQLLSDQTLWNTRVRLVGHVRPGSVHPRLDGVRFVVEDKPGTAWVRVDYAGDIPNELRGGRVVDVTGRFVGRAFAAQPNTLVVLCGRAQPQQHC